MPRLPSHAALLTRVGPARSKWGPPPHDLVREPVAAGQESVWDYPRPPRVDPVPVRVRVVHRGVVLADTAHAKRIVETAGAPVIYLPPNDVRLDCLIETDHVTVCEWKGAAVHYDVVVNGVRAQRAAFSYPDPLTDLGQGYEQIAGWMAFYAGRVDEATLDGERVTPQPGGLYAGWVTTRIVGPIKGLPGTGTW